MLKPAQSCDHPRNIAQAAVIPRPGRKNTSPRQNPMPALSHQGDCLHPPGDIPAFKPGQPPSTACTPTPNM